MRPAAEPPADCALCPRLVAYRAANAAAHPDWHNAPAASFGPAGARLLVLGLAPGRAGANRTGRPFTGDGSGLALFAALRRFGFAEGDVAGRADAGVVPVDCLISNAVRCAPPQNRPSPAEIAACRPFLAGRIAAMPRLRVAVCLGRVAHDALLRALGARPGAHPFAHGARHAAGGLAIFDSYHCSRYNMNTGRLTPEMLAAVFAAARAELGGPARGGSVSAGRIGLQAGRALA